jgi:hypothetical protein
MARKINRDGQIINSDFQNLNLYKIRYVKLNKYGNRDKDDSQEYSVHILAKDLDNAMDYISKRVGCPVHLTEFGDEIAVHAIAHPDYSRDLAQWKNSHDLEQQLARQKFDFYKLQNSTVEEKPSAKDAGSITLSSAW